MCALIIVYSLESLQKTSQPCLFDFHSFYNCAERKNQMLFFFIEKDPLLFFDHPSESHKVHI